MKFHKVANSGFTLIEVMLASAIAIVAFASISSLAISTFGTKSDLDRRQIAIQNAQDLGRTLSNSTLCEVNLTQPPGIQYNYNSDPRLGSAGTGIPISFYNIDNTNNITNQPIAIQGFNKGGLTMDSVSLVHSEAIDLNQMAAKIVVTYHNVANGPPIKSEIPIILTIDPNKYNLVTGCFAGDLLSSLASKSVGQSVCLGMQNLFYGGTWIYDPTTGACYPLPIDYKWYYGTTATASCPADHPYYTSCWVDTNGMTFTCPAGSTCSYQYQGGSNSNVQTYRCTYQTGSTGQDGAFCDYAEGATGGTCMVECQNRL